MSENINTIEQPNAGTPIPGEVHTPPAAEPQINEVETRAKAMGWVPKDEFRGPADKWRDADEFVRRGEEELPVLRERNRDLSRRYTELESRLGRQEQEFNARVQRQEHMAAIALRQQREYLESQYEAAKRHAVEIGDTARYEQLNRDQRQAVQQFDETVHQAAVQPKLGQQDRANAEAEAKVNNWVVENPWFIADPALNRYAQAVHVNLQRSKPGMTIEENLAEVAKQVRGQFPEKFGAGGQGRAPSVEGGNGMASPAKRSKGYSDLPPEAQRAAQEFVRAGAFKTTAEYAKSYWSMEGA